jgi:hypothetical protein
LNSEFGVFPHPTIRISDFGFRISDFEFPDRPPRRGGGLSDSPAGGSLNEKTVDQFRALGYDAKGMGKPLTEALKDADTEVLTF